MVAGQDQHIVRVVQIDKVYVMVDRVCCTFVPFTSGLTCIWRQNMNSAVINGEITVDGSYTVFFDPTVSGGSDWFYGCIFIDMPDPADMFLLGDADGSGEVDAVDATVIQRAATKVKLPYDQKTLMQGDVDDDGELTVIDATFVLRYTSLAPTPYRIGEYVSR